MEENLSEGATILSCTSDEEMVERILYGLVETIERELYCFVYLECDDCCFVPYAYYDDIIGEINIDSSLPSIERLIALAHEVGHILDNSKTQNVVQEELNAWHLGYKFMLIEGIVIDSEEYFDKMYECLSEYIEKENK